MSTIGSNLETSLAQAAAFAHDVARLRDRQSPKTESGRAVKDQLDLRTAGADDAAALRTNSPSGANKKADQSPARDQRTRNSAKAAADPRRIDLKA